MTTVLLFCCIWIHLYITRELQRFNVIRFFFLGRPLREQAALGKVATVGTKEEVDVLISALSHISLCQSIAIVL